MPKAANQDTTRRLPKSINSAFIDALKEGVHVPETPQGVAYATMRLILLASPRVPAQDEILDLYVVCLNAANGRRQERNYTAH
ncbi:MAG: hypothetical protein AB7H90_01490 [Alphaproteobacteria bacterium]